MRVLDCKELTRLHSVFAEFQEVTSGVMLRNILKADYTEDVHSLIHMEIILCICDYDLPGRNLSWTYC